jgi:nucleoside 2-deoxyribosyltransferase
VKIYLAGPEVFFYDAPIVFEKAVAAATALGITPLSPFDAVPSSHIKTDIPTANRIYKGNVGLIDSADAVIANLNSFRGSEPDSGTVFEVGYAVAKGKRVIGFLDDLSPYHTRVAQVMRIFQDDQGRWRDEEQRWVEEMGLPLNLMLGCSVELVAGGLQQALEQALTPKS